MEGKPLDNDTISEAPVLKDWYIYPAALFSLFILLTLVGNIITVIAFFRDQSLKTPTNYLICSQSAADILVGSSGGLFVFLNYLPTGIEIATNNKAACLLYLWLVCFSLFSNIVSIFALSVERLMFLIAPYGSLNMPKKMKTVKVSIGLIWATLFIWISPPLFGWNIWTPGHRCVVFTAYPEAFRKAMLIVPVFVSLLVTPVVNIAILLAFHKHQLKVAAMSRGNDGENASNQQPQLRNSKVTKMVLTVVLVFYACWLPYLSMIVIKNAAQAFYFANPILGVIEEFIKPLLLLNSTLNPLIYAHRNAQFKRAFTNMFKCS